MRTQSSLLLPIFRSAGQGRLLARLFLHDTPATVADLARELQLDPTTISREADRLGDAGLVLSDRIGRQRQLRANPNSPYFGDLRSLLVKAFGPVGLLADALAEIEGVERAFVFGSWAARHLGETGAAPNDLDVLIVGSPDRRSVARLSRALAAKLGVEVNPTVVPSLEWRSKRSGFLRSIASGPLVEVPLP